MNLPKLVADLQGAEGFRASPYKDSRGYLTVGYGWCLDTTPMSEAAGHAVLVQQVSEKAAALRARTPIFDTLDEVRQRALVEMAYNLGVEGLLRFTLMWGALARKDWNESADQALSSTWAQQVGSVRSGRLAAMLRTGVDAT